jgi:hypothetical protein
MQALHRTWPPVLAFCQDLAAELGHPVQANAYVTPPQNQGFSDHYDVHDVFVLQIEGEKRWSIHEPVLESPLRDQQWNSRRADVERRATEPPVIETVLRPGDCLYLPRGFLHAAQALGGISTHLTIGIHVWTRYAVAERLLQHVMRSLAGNARIRGSLPLGIDFVDGAIDDDLDAVRRALVAAIESVEPTAITGDLRTAARGTSRAAPIGPLAQFRAAERIEAATIVRLRDQLAATVEPGSDGRPVVCSRADDLALDPSDGPLVETLLLRGSMTAGDLGLELARRLIRAGLAIAASDAPPE